MCYNCGCEMPDDPMGHQENIITQTFTTIAGTMGMDPHALMLKVMHDLESQLADPTYELEPDIENMFEKASQAWGQPIEEAKKNTLALLKKTLKH